MAYDTYEISVEQGAPVELFEISIGTDNYYLASTDKDFTVGSTVYTGAFAYRSAISSSKEEALNPITFSLPMTHDFVKKYIKNVPGKKALLTIYRIHQFDVAVEKVFFWKGIVQSIAFSNDGEEAKVSVLPLTGLVGQQIPRQTFQGLCSRVLYDPYCAVSETSNRYQSNITALNATTITVNGLFVKGSGWANGGFAFTTSGSDYRLVLEHINSDVRLLLPFPDYAIANGDQIIVASGCDHSIATCKTKFNNVVNYGGFAFIPLKNPFQTKL